jgi:Bacteriophage tail sheath protein
MAVQEAKRDGRRRRYEAPGIYRHLKVTNEKDVRLVRTDIAGFVGFTERGPIVNLTMSDRDAVRTGVRLTSWKEYVSTFGWFLPQSHLAYAVRGFFENGGTTCYVVRVAATRAPDVTKQPATARFTFPGRPVGAGNDLSISAVSVLSESVEAGESEVSLESTLGFAAGDLVRISGEGIEEFLLVEIPRDASVLKLAVPLQRGFKKGTVVSRYIPALQIAASSNGSWGNRLRVAVTPLTSGEEEATEFSLRITVDRGDDRERPIEEEFYRKLSLNPKSELFAPRILNKRSHLIEVSFPKEDRDSHLPAFIGFLVQDDAWRLEPIYLCGGRDGLEQVSPADMIGGTDDLRGLRILEEINEIAILCLPDAVSADNPPKLEVRARSSSDPCKPDTSFSASRGVQLGRDAGGMHPAWRPDQTQLMYRSMIDQCERLRDRVAVLDVPLSKVALSMSQLRDWRDKFVTRFGAIYYPWLTVPGAGNPNGRPWLVPPCGHVAGIYARIDNQFGVQRPPGNEPFEFVTDVTEEITSLQQEQLNPYGINVIRSFPGRGIRIWGVRSLAQAENDVAWQFIHVRRVMSMIEESVDESMQWAVFEPNDAALRKTVVHSLSVFLEAIWLRGGLKGNVPAEGFYVKCDETNNPQSVIDAGQLVCEVGVAVVAPMEFLVFEIRHSPSGAAIAEI